MLKTTNRWPSSESGEFVFACFFVLFFGFFLRRLETVKFGDNITAAYKNN